MIKIFYSLLLVPMTAFVFASCNEELSMVEYVLEPPAIESFEPVSGAPGAVVTIKGQNLSHVDSVCIGQVMAPIVSRTNDKQMQISMPVDGATGKITVKNTKGFSVSSSLFTYEYPIPTISTYPMAGDVASVVVFFGFNMASITEVFIATETAQIVSSKIDELAVRIPNIAVGAAAVKFTYKNGTATTATINGSQSVVVTKTAPVFDPLTLPSTVNVGDKITIKGSNLEKIDSIKLGGVKMNIARITPDGLSIDIVFVDDKYAFYGGVNTRDFVAYGLFGTEFPCVDALKINTPKVLAYKNSRVEIGQNAGNTGQFFFNLEEGVAVSGKSWRIMDRVAYSRMVSGGAAKGPSSASNMLVRSGDGAVSKNEYYSVPPYFYMMYVSSSFPIIMPAGTGTLIRSVNADPATTNSATEKTVPNNGTVLYGTPLMVYRALNPNDANEKAIIDKVHDGSIVDDLLSKEIIKDWDFSTVKGPGDHYGNQLGFNNATLPQGGKAAGTTRPYLGQFTAPQIIALPASGPATEVDITMPEPVNGVYKEGSNVVLIIYYDYNFTGSAFEYNNIRKIGFMEFKKICNGGPYDTDKGAAWTGRIVQNAYFDINIYWQRTPEDGWAIK